MISVSGGLDAWQRLSSLNHMAALLFPGWLDSFSPQPCTKQATSERETSPVSQWWVAFMYYWFVLFCCFCVPAHSHITASYEALRINRIPHKLWKYFPVSCLLLWKGACLWVYQLYLLKYRLGGHAKNCSLFLGANVQPSVGKRVQQQPPVPLEEHRQYQTIRVTWLPDLPMADVLGWLTVSRHEWDSPNER